MQYMKPVKQTAVVKAINQKAGHKTTTDQKRRDDMHKNDKDKMQNLSKIQCA